MGYGSYYGREKQEPPKLLVGAVALILLIMVYYSVTTTVARVSEPGGDVIVVGLNTPYPPFEERYADSNKVVGLDVDLAQRIADETGRKLVVMDYSDFGSIWTALQTDQIDMAISAISITPARQEVFDFSEPYFASTQAVLVTESGKFAGKGNLTAADFAGMRIGYQQKTTSEDWVISNLNGTALAGNQSFGDMNLGLQYLQMNQIDALILDKPVAEIFARDHPGLKVAGVIAGTEDVYGIAVRRGTDINPVLDKNADLLADINATLAEMKTSEKGKPSEYDELLGRYFGGSQS